MTLFLRLRLCHLFLFYYLSLQLLKKLREQKKKKKRTHFEFLKQCVEYDHNNQIQGHMIHSIFTYGEVNNVSFLIAHMKALLPCSSLKVRGILSSKLMSIITIWQRGVMFEAELFMAMAIAQSFNVFTRRKKLEQSPTLVQKVASLASSEPIKEELHK